MNSEDVHKLKAFIGVCEANPSMLYSDDLKFFRDYLTKLGATIPPADTSTSSASSTSSSSNSSSHSAERQHSPPRAPTPPPEVESEESEVELDNSGVIDAETDELPEMGDLEKSEVSEEDMDKAGEKRSEAQAAFCDADYKRAAQLYTDAILINPTSAMLYAKRASCYLRVQRPRAAVRDCDRAIQLNADSASGYKFRGRAHRLLGNWIEAASDLRTACKLDFDEQSDEWLKEVTPNAHKLEEHRRKYQRREEEKELRQRQERVRRAREEHVKAREDAERCKKETGPCGGAGGMPGGIPAGMAGLFNDPEVMAAMQDPEVMTAFADVSSNPANMAKYQNNPKVMALIAKMSSKMGGAAAGAGFPGGMPGGMGGAAGFPGGMGGGMPGGMGGGFAGSNGQPTAKGPDMDVD